MAPRQRGHPPRSGAPPATESEESLAAWRFDAREEAFALLVLTQSTGGAIWDRLTAAERDVARLIVAGLSNSEIARRREVSPRTVANQAARIFRKLGVRSRLELYALLAHGGFRGEARR